MLEKIKILGLFEIMCWLGAICFLIIIDPSKQTHFTLCPLANLGFDFCPGCGLGRSVSYFLHFQLKESLQTHPLGIVAIIILCYRIITLVKLNIMIYKKNKINNY
ncbi:MAG: hypothetical protein B7C24_15505 [Bacteroidetes bacterium 4572_77]|nr:MAG: hypothetical protein B7C24_15505 [Bacteroidetes bacterium 4572_77]